MLAWVGGVVVLALGVLLAWPPGADQQSDDPLADFSVAGWPARGSEAESPSQVRSLAAAWAAAARDGALVPPGDAVEPVYIGEVDGTRVGLARSRSQTGGVVVAAAIEDGSGWRVLDAAEVASEVSWLALPGSGPPRVLAAPDVAAASSLLLRRDAGVWTRAAIREDGVTATLRSLDGPVPVLGVVGRVGAGRGLLDIAGLSRTSVLPVDPPVQAGAPRWGRSSALTPEEYDSALYAAPALPDAAGRLAVLASARVPGGRAVLAETSSEANDGEPQRVLVVPGPDGQASLGPAPAVQDGLAAGVAVRDGGRALVLVATAPSLARVEVVLPDGTSAIDGRGPTAVVLAPPLPDEVTVLGKRTNGSVVARLSMPLGQSAGGSPPG